MSILLIPFFPRIMPTLQMNLVWLQPGRSKDLVAHRRRSENDTPHVATFHSRENEDGGTLVIPITPDIHPDFCLSKCQGERVHKSAVNGLLFVPHRSIDLSHLRKLTMCFVGRAAMTCGLRIIGCDTYCTSKSSTFRCRRGKS